MQKIDNEIVKEKLLPRIDVVEEQKLEGIDEDGQSFAGMDYFGEDGSALTIASNNLSFDTEQSRYIEAAFKVWENADMFKEGSEFAFGSSEDILDEIKKELGELGIEIGSELSYSVYSLDYNTLQQEEQYLDIEGNVQEELYKSTWDEEDNSYYFFCRQQYQGLPVYYVYAGAFHELAEENTPIQVIYSSRGMEKLAIDKIFKFEQSNELVALLPFEEVADTIARKYGEILTNASYTVVRAELFQMAQKTNSGSYNVFPVWIFEIIESTINDANGNSAEHTIQEIVNATTGESISE